MKPLAVITCIPSSDLNKSLKFYQECFALPDLAIEHDAQITVELANLKLFIMNEESYEHYIENLDMTIGYTGTSPQVIHSVALNDTVMIEHVFDTAEVAGGYVAAPLSISQCGQPTGYVQDPDGHLWEIVQI